VVPLGRAAAGAQGRRLYLTHLGRPAARAFAQTVLDTIARLCPDVVVDLRGHVDTWGMRFRQDGWHPIGIV
jgi:hypothetical protein